MRVSACGQWHTGVFPDDVTAPTQYGAGVLVFVAVLNNADLMPIKKIQQLFVDLSGSAINEHTIVTTNATCYAALAPMITYKSAVLAFAFFPEVPFTNNQAERDLRPSKVKQKIAGCFRTLLGAEHYARIASFVATARKQHRQVFKELRRIFSGTSFLLEAACAK